MLQELQWIDYREPTVEIALALVRAAYHAPDVALPDPLPPAPAAPLSYQAQLVDRVYGAEALNVDQQLAVVYTLRQWIESGSDPAQVLQLATRFRERGDLLASVSTDLDAVIARPDRRVRPDAGRSWPSRRPARVTSDRHRPCPICRVLLRADVARCCSERSPRAAALVVVVVIGSIGDDGDQAAADTTAAAADTTEVASDTTEATADTLDTAFADTVPDPVEAFELEVPGAESVTDTGLYLYPGDVVSIEAAGSIVHDTLSGGSAEPPGDPNPDLAQYNVTSDADHGALLYWVGEGTAPLPVGWFVEWTVEQEGELYLGPNDAGVENNDGRFDVVVTIASAG